MLLFRAVFWAFVLPGTVTILVPYLIMSRWWPIELSNWRLWQAIGLVPVLIGASILLHCIWSFAVVGRGTLSSLDPPRQLVVRGLYRYVRNPMYVGVVTALLGQAWLFGSLAMLCYAVTWFLVFNLFVIFYEEPALRRQFGESYEPYCRRVRRWLPGSPIDGTTGPEAHEDIDIEVNP